MGFIKNTKKRMQKQMAKGFLKIGYDFYEMGFVDGTQGNKKLSLSELEKTLEAKLR